MELRYYYDQERNISLTFLQAYGDLFVHPHGRLEPILAHSLREHGVNSNFGNFTGDRRREWRYADWSELVAQHLARLSPPPSVVVLNAGHWPSTLSHSPASRGALIAAIEAMGAQSLWRTTTFSKSHRLPGSRVSVKNTGHALSPEIIESTDSAMCARTTTFCLNASWTHRLAESEYRDGNHFEPPGYNRINCELLRLLGSACSAPPPPAYISDSGYDVS